MTSSVSSDHGDLLFGTLASSSMAGLSGPGMAHWPHASGRGVGG
jgi:hypothetical protein